MSLFICANCNLRVDSDLSEMHPVTRNLCVCDKCYENDPKAQADVARFEDQCDDAACEDKINDY